MRQLKAFINKNAIKRMRHNKEHQLFLLWPNSITQVEKIESLSFININTDKCKCKGGGMIFFLTKEQMSQVISIEKLTDHNCEVWKIIDLKVTKESLKEIFENSGQPGAWIVEDSSLFEQIYLSKWDS